MGEGKNRGDGRGRDQESGFTQSPGDLENVKKMLVKLP